MNTDIIDALDARRAACDAAFDAACEAEGQVRADFAAGLCPARVVCDALDARRAAGARLDAARAAYDGYVLWTNQS